MTRRVGPRLVVVPCELCGEPVHQIGAVRGRYRDYHPECLEIATSLRRLWKALDVGTVNATDARKNDLARLIRSNVLSHLCSTFNTIKANGSKKPPENIP